jgi:hypothetical protein
MTNMILPGSKYANKLSRTYPTSTVKPKEVRDPVITLAMQPAGNWTIQINGGQAFPATIAEIALNNRIIALEAELKAAQAEVERLEFKL